MSKILISIIAVVVLVGIGLLYDEKKDVENPADGEIPLVRIGGTEIPVEVAKTDQERAKGLSGRDFLEPDKGMLFVFSQPGNYNFWMPDMNFPIDIIWITGGKIVGIEKDVPNEFDPQNPVFYLPPKPVEYVLEVNAGFVQAHGIKIGDDVIFRNIE